MNETVNNLLKDVSKICFKANIKCNQIILIISPDFTNKLIREFVAIYEPGKSEITS